MLLGAYRGLHEAQLNDLALSEGSDGSDNLCFMGSDIRPTRIGQHQYCEAPASQVLLMPQTLVRPPVGSGNTLV
jgi:hypothetical protein